MLHKKEASIFANCYSYGMEDYFILLHNLLVITLPINMVTFILHMVNANIFYIWTLLCEQMQPDFLPLSSRDLRRQADTLHDKC